MTEGYEQVEEGVNKVIILSCVIAKDTDAPGDL